MRESRSHPRILFVALRREGEMPGTAAPDGPLTYALTDCGCEVVTFGRIGSGGGIDDRPDRSLSDGDHGNRSRILGEFDASLEHLRPDVVAIRSSDPLARDVLSRSAARGAARALWVEDADFVDSATLAEVDLALVPSRFLARYLLEAYGVDAAVVPPAILPSHAVAGDGDPRYLTFLDPTPENGVYAFARIAEELAGRRPDIPVLVIEGRGTEATVAACGLELRRHGSVFFMGATPDPRLYWGETRVCLIPSLAWDASGHVAGQAVLNGIPVLASDRGSLPETVGDAGLVLPLPDRLTPATRWLPTPAEVAPWVEAILHLWDDRRPRGGRWVVSEAMRRGLLRRVEALCSRGVRPPVLPPGRAEAAVLVPFLHSIEWPCEQGLRALEQAGVRVVRWEGSSAIDVVRNRLASDALHDGFEAILFIDADVGFDPTDGLRLLARPEPVVAGIYAKKGRRELASRFADGLDAVSFGPGSGPYPLKYAGTGFLRVHSWALRRMIDELGLPLCNTGTGRGTWPFFQPTIIPDHEGGLLYLGEDWAFSHRLSLIGVTPLADTSIRLWHIGKYGYGWEDAGEDRPRSASHRLSLTDPGRGRDGEGR